MRSNANKTTKTTDTQDIRGWNLTYTYESQGGAKPAEIHVNGTLPAEDGLSSASMFLAKQSNSTSVSFVNASMDIDLIKAVAKEIQAIEDDFVDVVEA